MYASATFWDAVYQRHDTTYGDEDGQGFWAMQWLPVLERSGNRKVLDLGCGVGVDCRTLAQHGLEVVGLDYSHEAITQAQAQIRDLSLPVRFLQADMANPLPFPDQDFDVVMSNVAFHSFPDRLLRSILGEIRRVVRQNGLVLLHVNSLEDMRYRPKDRAQEIEPDYYLESDGQTMHFFSEAYCRDLFHMWNLIDLSHLHYPPRGQWVDKCVWRVVAQKIAAPHGDLPAIDACAGCPICFPKTWKKAIAWTSLCRPDRTGVHAMTAKYNPAGTGWSPSTVVR